jgi:Cu/Ag efflux pump CusA
MKGSAMVPILTIPISVVLAFIPMYLMGLNANLMSLAGIATSIGILVEGAIVEVIADQYFPRQSPRLHGLHRLLDRAHRNGFMVVEITADACQVGVFKD